MKNFSFIALVASLAPLVSLQAQTASTNNPALTRTLETVYVTASPLAQNEDLDVLQPVQVIGGDRLRLKEGTNLGASLATELGVQSSAYGAGAGRPIIRGLEGARVAVTESGITSGDVSSVSPDHRVAVDIFNAQQVEILRGPSALLYGSGAIGGLVNVVNQRIPLQHPQNLGGELNLRAGSAEHETLAAFGLNAPLGEQSALRLEGFKQRTGNYELANSSERLANSATDTQSLSLGSSWFTEAGLLGAAITRYESEYGIPNPDEPVTIKLKRNRLDTRADLDQSFGVFTALRSKLSFVDYQHTEFEPDGAAGATFKNRGFEGRLELPHAPLAGWQGVTGVQFNRLTTSGQGEGFLPNTRGQALALFAVEERKIGVMRYELGARAEQQRFNVKEGDETGVFKPSRDFSLFSLSGASGWAFTPGYEFTASLALSQRAPAVEELYFEGVHPATFAYEIGNSSLGKETSQNLEFGVRKTAGWWQWRASVFQNRFKDYIYGSFDGSTTDVDGEAFYNLAYQQDNARFRGVELEAAVGEKTGWHSRMWGDMVRAQITSGINSGHNVPRLAPARFGLDLGYRAGVWSGLLALTRVAEQNRTSSFDLRNGVPETATAAYTLLDLSATYAWRNTTLYLQGRNLTDEEARVHTSFLKDFAPLPGRSVVLGVKAAF